MKNLRYSPYSPILSSSWSSGTTECRYHRSVARTECHIPAPIVVFLSAYTPVPFSPIVINHVYPLSIVIFPFLEYIAVPSLPTVIFPAFSVKEDLSVLLVAVTEYS